MYCERTLRDIRLLKRAGFRVSLDEFGEFICIHGFRLPRGWSHSRINVLIMLTDYPRTGPGTSPNFVYLPAGMTFRGRQPREYRSSDALGKGWAWWCFENLRWDARDAGGANLLFFADNVLRFTLANPLL